MCQENTPKLLNPTSKFTEGKVPMNLVLDYFPHALEELGRVCDFGAQKYGAYTYKEVPVDKYIAALMRHLIASRKNTRDGESDLLHWSHVAWNAMVITQILKELIDEELS